MSLANMCAYVHHISARYEIMYTPREDSWVLSVPERKRTVRLWDLMTDDEQQLIHGLFLCTGRVMSCKEDATEYVTALRLLGGLICQ